MVDSLVSRALGLGRKGGRRTCEPRDDDRAGVELVDLRRGLGGYDPREPAGE